VQGRRVYSSNSEYRFHPDLAVNHCNDVTVGYTKSSSSMFRRFTTGRQATDPQARCRLKQLIKAGEITYTSFEATHHAAGVTTPA
jgi:hypothetical protein